MLVFFYGLIAAGVIIGGVALGLNAQERLLPSDAWVATYILVAILVIVAGLAPFAVRHGRVKKAQ